MSPVILPTDVLLFLFVAAFAAFLLWARRIEKYRYVGGRILASRSASLSLAVMALYLLVAVLDSVHYRPLRRDASGAVLLDLRGAALHADMRSLLDDILVGTYGGIEERDQRVSASVEEGYSSPGAGHLFEKDMTTDPDSGLVTLRDKPLDRPGSHLQGTDKAGSDIFYCNLKSIRLAIIVGLATTLVAVPFAILFGVIAGYFGGWLDDLVQYLYTTISSIPDILLIAGLAMILQARILAESAQDIVWRDDFMVACLCGVMGLVSWSGLCRLIRAETLKLRELDYVQASRAMGVGRASIILRHIVPNVMHIAVISFILKFSGLVMTIIVLSYLNIGIPSSVHSWGRMIDRARDELARNPMIAWPVLSAFATVFILLLAVNRLGDVMRDALDPRLRS